MATAKKTALRLTMKKLLEDMPTRELKSTYDHVRQIRYALHYTHFKAGNLSFVKKLAEFEKQLLDEQNNRNPNIRRK